MNHFLRYNRGIAVNTTVKRSSAISKNVSFWAGQIPAGQTSPKGTISEMAARAFYCCLYAMPQPISLPGYVVCHLKVLIWLYACALKMPTTRC